MNANPNNPDSFVSSLRQTTINNGGTTVRFAETWFTGKNPGTRRYIVGGIGPSFTVSHDELYRGGATIKNNLFGKGPDGGFLDLWKGIPGCEGFGTWYDPKTGLTWFDPILTVDNLRDAMEVAVKLEQIAVFDQVDGITINVNGKQS